MPKYTVLSPLNLNGKLIAPGKTVDLSEDDAQQAVEAGALEAHVAVEKKSGKKETTAQE